VGTIDDRIALEFSLSGGEAADCVEGRKLLLKMGPVSTQINLIMDKAYSDDKTRELAQLLGYTPVTPPKSNRIEPWEYDKEEYKHRNEVERFFRRYKEYRRICTRYDKLDIMFLNYFIFALIVEMLKLI
jgi:transposase